MGHAKELVYSRSGPARSLLYNSIARLAVTACAAMHADPADRIIVATALYLGASVVTHDEKIKASGLVPCIW